MSVSEAQGSAQCSCCGRSLVAGYKLRGGDVRCTRHAVFHPAVLWRSLVTALVVGTVLTGINHGDEIVHGALTAVLALKIALTYFVPFCVSTSGALGAARTTALANENQTARPSTGG